MATRKVVSLRLVFRLKYEVLVSFQIYTDLRATPPFSPYTHTVGGRGPNSVCVGGGRTLRVIDSFSSLL